MATQNEEWNFDDCSLNGKNDHEAWEVGSPNCETTPREATQKRWENWPGICHNVLWSSPRAKPTAQAK